LLLPGERKSVEPIAAVTAPARVSAKHQSLLHFGCRRGLCGNGLSGSSPAR
jgi:SRSO17 transposase